jgi:allantoicase
VDVDTSFFTGNHVPRCSIQAATLDDEPVREPADTYLQTV